MVVFGLIACRHETSSGPGVDGGTIADVDADVDAPADDPVPPLVTGGALQYAKRAGGGSGGGAYDSANGIGVLSDGSWLVAGRYSSSDAVFGAGEANETTLAPSPYGEYDGFLARYNADGTLAWAKRVVAGPTFQDDQPRDLVVLADGSSIMSGTFEGTTTVFGMTQDITLTGSNYASFLARFDPNGYAVWAVSAPAGELAVYDATITSAVDKTVSRYADTGTLMWSKQTVTATGYSHATGVVVTTDGDVLVTGEIQGSVTFGSGEPHETTLDSSTFSGYIAKYDATGGLVWAKLVATGTGSATPTGLALLDDGDLVMSGYFGQTESMGSMSLAGETLAYEGLDIFVARFSADGVLRWVRKGTCSGNEFAYGVAAAGDGSSIVVGGSFGVYSGATLTLGESPSTVTLTRQGRSDAFIASFTGDGNLRWAKRAGGTDDVAPVRVEMFSDKSTLITGPFSQEATFGPGEPNATTLTALGNADPFFAKLSP